MENKSNVNAFKATLPDSKSQLQKLITLEFFACEKVYNLIWEAGKRQKR
jgi:hypothetical protein